MWPTLAALLRLIDYPRLPVPPPTSTVHVAVDGATVPFPLQCEKPTGAHLAYVAFDTPPLVPLISMSETRACPDFSSPPESWLEGWVAVLVEPVHANGGSGDNLFQKIEAYRDAVSRRAFIRHVLYADGGTEETPCSPNAPAESLGKILRYVAVHGSNEVVIVLTTRPDALLHFLMLIRRLEHLGMPVPYNLVLSTSQGDIPVYAVYEALHHWFQQHFPACLEPIAHCCLIAQVAQEKERLSWELWCGLLGFFSNRIPSLPLVGAPQGVLDAPKQSVAQRQHLFQGFLGLDTFSTASLAYHIPDRWLPLASTWMLDALGRSIPGGKPAHGPLEILARAEALQLPVKLVVSSPESQASLNRAVFSSLNYLSLAWFVDPTYFLWLREELWFRGHVGEARTVDEIKGVIARGLRHVVIDSPEIIVFSVAALLEVWAPNTASSFSTVKTHATIDSYLELQRPKFFRFFERSLRRETTPYTSVNFKAWGVTLAGLVKEAGVSLPAVSQYGLIATPDDLKNLGVVTLDDLVAIAPPRKWRSLGDVVRLHPGIVLTPVEWIKSPGAWRPQDLAVLGINLDTWFEKYPKMKEAAHRTTATWFAKEKKLERWGKYAGLKKHTPLNHTNNTSSLL